MLAMASGKQQTQQKKEDPRICASCGYNWM